MKNYCMKIVTFFWMTFTVSNWLFVTIFYLFIFNSRLQFMIIVCKVLSFFKSIIRWGVIFLTNMIGLLTAIFSTHYSVCVWLLWWVCISRNYRIFLYTIISVIEYSLPISRFYFWARPEFWIRNCDFNDDVNRNICILKSNRSSKMHGYTYCDI